MLEQHTTVSNEVTVQELAQRIAAGNPPLIAEILAPAYFASGHLPGALNLPLDGLPARAEKLFARRDAEIVVYCAGPTCQNSHVAARKLASMGYGNVRVFAGGKSAWQDAGHALVVSV
jgi:rhodanese-related sulfurtransferase